MNGIRYASGCLGFSGPQKLLRDIPRNWRNKTGIIRAEVHSFPSRRFHDSTLRHCAADKDHATSQRVRNVDLSTGPGLADFIQASTETKSTIDTNVENIPYLNGIWGGGRKVYFDIYGCQMNVNDSEVIWSILKKNGYTKTDELAAADVVLVVTCAIREGAEDKVWHKLDNLKGLKAKRTTKKNANAMKIGILGCMAERLKNKIIERNQAVDVIAGPDSYKDLPRLLARTMMNETAINVILSFDETYADITPVRLNENSISAFVTIMRGCDNMCTYCIVPFTRGRERSRPISSILSEIQHLSDQGVKEVTLLGQNVNSYRDLSISNFYTPTKNPTSMAKGFNTVYKNKIGGVRFSDLLDKVSLVNPEMRIRFTSPHPKDFPDEVLRLIAERPNICRQLHLPAQSGNSAVLERMRRGYTREAYLELVDHVQNIIPNVSLSSDFIAGFCGETEEEFQDTLSLLEQVRYNKAYLFAYSMREKTTAHRRFEDNVETSIKKERLQRMIDLCKTHTEKLNKQQIGSKQLVLIEGKSRKSKGGLIGRNDANTRVVIPHGADLAVSSDGQSRSINLGDYVVVEILEANSNTLSGVPLYHSTISDYVPLVEDREQRLTDSR